MFLSRHQILNGIVEVKSPTEMQAATSQITIEVVTLLILT